MKAPAPRESDRRRGTRGAVYIEFLIAFLPLLTFFLCIWQVSILYTTKLFVDHAAFSGARAAAVVIAENSNRVNDSDGPASVNVLTGRRNRLVQDAVGMALMPLILDGTVVTYNVLYPDPATPGGPNVMLQQTYPGMTQTTVSMARVRVRAMMNCKIAFANAVMCNGLFSQIGSLIGAGPIFPPYLYVVSEAIFPYQGASYKYDPNDDSGSNGGQASNNTGSPFASNNISGCFAAGTPVETASGPRPIETIAAGDAVLSQEEASGVLSFERVVGTSVTEDRPLVDVRIVEGDTIRATPNHLFWTADRGWVHAGELLPGESLESARFGELHVASVEPEAEHATVYNFEVDPTHTYFVGAATALVHNQVVCDGGAGSSSSSSQNGPGTWNNVNRAMSAAAAQYQCQVAGTTCPNPLPSTTKGAPMPEYNVNGVNFDGWDGTQLIEAKSNYAQFVDPSTGNFYSWWTGAQPMANEARSQLAAAGSTPVTWYFQQQSAMTAAQQYLASQGITGINFVYQP